MGLPTAKQCMMLTERSVSLLFAHFAGTRTVIDACIRQNVPYLVFTSTVDVVVSSNHIFFGAENTTFTPKHFLMGPYAETKHRAEQLVLQANQRVLADGEAHPPSLLCAWRPGGETDRFAYCQERKGLVAS